MTAVPDLDELRARRDLYRLASRLLAREIDAPLYERLRKLGLLDGEPAPELPSLVALPSLEELAAEFCRLFVGPRPVCLPYASARQSPPLLRGEPERRFLAFLAGSGLKPVVDRGPTLLGSDHLAVELGVLAHLYDQVCSSHRSDVPAWRQARTLVAEHLMPWGAEVASEIADAARLAPYRPVAEWLAELLREEESLQPLRSPLPHP